jgi:antitoxin HicB
MEARYLIDLAKNEDGGYTVTVPALPGCITEGATWNEAVANAQEAIIGYLKTLQDLGKPIPVEIPVEIEPALLLPVCRASPARMHSRRSRARGLKSFARTAATTTSTIETRTFS